MKKVGLSISTILFSLFLILPSMSFAHGGEHDKSSDHGKESKGGQQYEEGSGSSAVEPSHEGKEYKSGHEEAEEEGSFSYKRHRKEMNEKKAMEKESHEKEEGSGSR